MERSGTVIECAHCGYEQRGSADVNGVPLCHEDSLGLDCYRLVTVYGHDLYDCQCWVDEVRSYERWR